MCLLFFQLKSNVNSSDEFKLILISVRDEYMCRPSTSVLRWPNSDIIGAQDMQIGREGGTWLAVNPKNGRIGILLNILQTAKDLNPQALGRGKMVSDLLLCEDVIQFMQSLATNAGNYNGFTFVAIDLKNSSASYVNSFVEPQAFNLEPDIYGFGNSKDPNKPWEKVKYGRNKFAEIVTDITSSDRKDELIDRLFLMVSDETKLEKDEKVWSQAYDWPEDHLQRLNSLCVKIPEKRYGSRTWSIILIDGNGNGDFIERTRVQPINMTDDDIKSEWKETRLSFECKLSC